MIEWLINKLNKKALSNVAKVELSIGPIYLKSLTNGIRRKCERQSCIMDEIINSPLFFYLMDYELSSLSKKQIDALSVSDGNKLRDAIRNILISEGIIKIEGTNNPENLSAEEIRKMEEMKAKSQDYLKKLREGTKV